MLLRKKNELIELVEMMPYHEGIFDFQPKNNIEKAAIFLALSNYTYLGAMNTVRFGAGNSKKITLENIKKTYDFLIKNNVQFANKDFRKFLKAIVFHNENEKRHTFVYCDPPYLGTSNNYSNGFTENDFEDLINSLLEFGTKFAISELDNEFVMEVANKYKLNITFICNRVNLKNRSNEILITNYRNSNKLF